MRALTILLMLTSIVHVADLRDGAPCAHRWLDKDGRPVTLIVDGECVYAAQFPNVKPRE